MLICRFVLRGNDTEVLRRFWVAVVRLSEKAINELLGSLLYRLTGHRVCGVVLPTLASTLAVHTTGNITKVVFDEINGIGSRGE
jgi:hypothetical protein